MVSIRNQRDIIEQMRSISVDSAGIDIMAPKALSHVIRVNDISCIAANILKQEMLSLGGEVAVARAAITGKLPKTDCLVFGTLRQLRHLTAKLKRQPYSLDTLSTELIALLDNVSRQEFIVSAGRHTLRLGRRTLVMGIVNLTPDSFSADGLYRVSSNGSTDEVIEHIGQMVSDGADIIDIGGESSRPGARPVSVKEEISRVVPVIKKAAKKIKVPISIDTCKPEVARAALENGASIVNNIDAVRCHDIMAKLVARFRVAMVLMHMKGRPRTMQRDPHYASLLSEIIEQLGRSLEHAVACGVSREKIIIDPGIGFGKTAKHNLEIISRLSEFRSLGRPILIGPSRKSFIGKVLDAPVQERLIGTIASVVAAIRNGAHIVRVHDVREVAQATRLADAIMNTR